MPSKWVCIGRNRKKNMILSFGKILKIEISFHIKDGGADQLTIFSQNCRGVSQLQQRDAIYFNLSGQKI